MSLDDSLDERMIQAVSNPQVDQLEIIKSAQDMTRVGDPVEGASLGFEGEAQPARVTGIGDGAEPVFGDSILTTAITGFNRGLGNLIDPVIYNGAVALRKIGEATGNPMLANIKPERNAFARVFASGDFETQNIMSNVLGIPINYGEGADIGVSPEEGLASEFAYGAGKFAGEGAPVAMGLQTVANLATKSAGLLTPKVAPIAGGTTANVTDDILRAQAVAPGTIAATEAGISGIAGGVTETTDSPILGIASAFAPAAIPGIIKRTPTYMGINWFRQRTPGKIGDLRDVATGAKSATEGEGGQLLVNKAQRMIQEQLNLNPEQAESAVKRFGEIVAKIPELETMAPGQVFDNQALIKTFQNAILDAPNEQIPALNALLEGYVSGATRFKGTIGVEGTDTGVTGNNILVMDSARKTFDLETGAQTRVVDDEEAFLGQQAKSIERTGAERQATRLGLQESLAKRVGEAKEALEKKKVELGLMQEKRPVKAATGKREKVLVKADDLVDPEAVLALQKRIQNEILPRAGTEAAGFDKLPASIKSLVQWDSSKDYSFRDWLLARDEVSNAISKGAVVGDTQLPLLMQYRDMLDDFAVGGFQNLGPKYKEFIDFAKTNYYEPFERSLIMGVTKQDKSADRFLTQGEQITNTFLKQEPEILQRFVNTVGKDAPEVNDLKNVLLDNLYDSAYSTTKGQWDETRLNKWMGDNKNYLELLPAQGDNNFFQELTNTQQLLQRSLLRRKQATERKEQIEKSLLGKFLQAQTRKGTLEPEEDFLTQLVMRPTKEGGQRTMVKTRNDFLASEEGKALGKTNAENIFRRTIFEKLDEQMKIMQDPEKFKGWMQQDKNTQLLKDAGFSESHMKDLYLLADASERINTIPILEFKGLNNNGIVSRIAEALGTSPAAVSTRVLAVKENRISPRTAFIYLASRAIGAQNEIRMNALMREAITDPQLAKMLTAELPDTNPVGRIPGPISRKVNNYLIGSGIEAVEQIDQEMDRGRPLITLPEQRFDVDPNSGATIETTPQNVPAPPPPSMDFTQVAPLSPNPAPTGGGQVKVSSLFPFDPLSAAIQERQQKQGQGIGSLMG